MRTCLYQCIHSKLYKKKSTSKRNRLCSRDSRLSLEMRTSQSSSVFRINFVARCCTLSNLVIFLAVKGDQTTNPQSSCDLTKVQYRVLSVETSLKSLQLLFIKPSTLLACENSRPSSLPARVAFREKDVLLVKRQSCRDRRTTAVFAGQCATDLRENNVFGNYCRRK